MPTPDRPTARGRGSQIAPPNRFGGTHHELDFEQLERDDEFLDGLRRPATEYLADRSRSIVAENDSPDVGFRYSINAYRGCSHGCSYCFARPTHEYLGFNAGLEFETRIMVKHEAPALFREFLGREGWAGHPIAMSGVTDCYQPGERRFRLTRGCLEVAAEARQPMMIITKNALILRDLDLLRGMAREGLIGVHVSITTLDAELARSMEPRTSTPEARLRAVRGLAEAGVPVGVLVAPVIPGLTDSEIPAILRAAREAGAVAAGCTMLRLPLTVAPVFVEWLERARPERAARVLGRVREARGGRLNVSDFATRMTGTGVMAGQVSALFRLYARKLGLDGGMPPLDSSRFRPPLPTTGQLRLF
ncbi:PA0069 family radical SAM protein [Tundrisphaera sp. TA3]|uniref:PA0069 family radical SAM protein n=1 Tax=Tundrisphaera sp. TA3 TaxID=3435775 RepID=UPI003EBE24D9